jgi:limonene-1,2-epoxide hydrolase
MSDQETKNIQLIRSYLNVLASGSFGDDLSKFFTPDAIQVEFPNILNTKGGQSDLTAILTRAEQGRNILAKQTYDIKSETAEDSRVAIEAVWTGTLAVLIGKLTPGSTMRAHFSIHFEMRDGRIAVQRNYDCFDPW